MGGRDRLYRGARTIAISGHTNPDGDALGSVLGLGLSIRAQFPDKRVDFLLADDGGIPRIYRFLPGASELVPAVRHPESYDLFISVDVPTLERLEDSAAVAKHARGRVVIDHHPTRDEFGDVTVRVTSAAATAVLVAELLDAAGWPITPDIASCLLTGIVTDTGRFQYQNANPSAFACASRLVDAGAQPATIALEVYQSQRLEYLHLRVDRDEPYRDACGWPRGVQLRVRRGSGRVRRQARGVRRARRHRAPGGRHGALSLLARGRARDGSRKPSLQGASSTSPR